MKDYFLEDETEGQKVRGDSKGRNERKINVFGYCKRVKEMG